jgi:hypothetical protein
MFGIDWEPRRLRKDRIAFAILFVVISSLLCLFVHISVPLYFALLFLSGLIAFFVSNTLLRWFDRMFAGMFQRRSRYRQKGGAYRHW